MKRRVLFLLTIGITLISIGFFFLLYAAIQACCSCCNDDNDRHYGKVKQQTEDEEFEPIVWEQSVEINPKEQEEVEKEKKIKPILKVRSNYPSESNHHKVSDETVMKEEKKKKKVRFAPVARFREIPARSGKFNGKNCNLQ